MGGGITCCSGESGQGKKLISSQVATEKILTFPISVFHSPLSF